jgi:hypothetical protein
MSLCSMLDVAEEKAKKLNLSDYHLTPPVRSRSTPAHLLKIELDGRRYRPVEFAVVTGTLSPKLEVIKIVRKKQP